MFWTGDELEDEFENTPKPWRPLLAGEGGSLPLTLLESPLRHDANPIEGANGFLGDRLAEAGE